MVVTCLVIHVALNLAENEHTVNRRNIVQL